MGSGGTPQQEELFVLQYPPSRRTELRRRSGERVMRVPTTALTLTLGLLMHTPARAQGEKAASSAAATPEETRDAQAEERFREGRSLLDQGRFQEACQKFEESLQPRLIARHVAQSRKLLRTTGRSAAGTGGVPARSGRGTERSGPQSAASLDGGREGTLGSRFRTVPQPVLPSPTPRVRVQVDGQPLERLGVPLRLNPGKHRVDASADQKLPFVQEITLVASQKLDLTLPALEDAPSGVSSAPPPYTFDSRRRRRMLPQARAATPALECYRGH